jgi:hypothetical protein
MFNKYYCGVKARSFRLAVRIAHMGETKNSYNILVGEPGGKSLLGGPRRRWESNDKIDLRETE